MNILECCSTFYNTLIAECFSKRNRIEIPVIKRNQLSESKIFTFEKPSTPVSKPLPKPVSNNYMIVNQTEDDDDEYDIV